MIVAATATPEGPYPFLAVVHPDNSGQAQIEVLHVWKQYTLSRLAIAESEQHLRNKIFAFGGELHNTEGITVMPTCYARPEPFNDSMVPSTVWVPKPDILEEALQNHLADATVETRDNLMPSNLACSNVAIPRVMAIPSLLTPIFIGGQSPRSALEKLKAVMAEFSADDQALFHKLFAYCRAACMKT